MPDTKAKGFALQWNIGFKVYLDLYIYFRPILLYMMIRENPLFKLHPDSVALNVLKRGNTNINL